MVNKTLLVGTFSLLAAPFLVAGTETETIARECVTTTADGECQWEDQQQEQQNNNDSTNATTTSGCETNSGDCSWDDLSDDYRGQLWRNGVTKLMWDRDEEPHFMAPSWEDLSAEYKEALGKLGWDASAFVSSEVPATSRLTWDQLSDEQHLAANVLGYDEKDWFLMSMKLAEEFEPLTLKLDIPEMKRFGFDYLKTLSNVEVAVADGATVDDDMSYMPDRYDMASYVEGALKGSTRYLKYEDYDGFKKKLPSEIGASVNKHLGGALKASKEMREKGHWQDVFDKKKFSDYNWSIWIGGKNTSTALHYDLDAMNFLWVLEGRKRVILIPNDERTMGTYSCIPEAPGNACWPGVDVLYTPELPEHAEEFFLGPGEGISIPELAWHAVQNLEPTVAFGFRINDGIWDQPWSALSDEERESVIAAGWTKETWTELLDMGRDFEGLNDDVNEDDAVEEEEEDDETSSQEEVDYSEVAWKDLPENYRIQMQLMGFTEKLWENENSYLEGSWEDLSLDEQNSIRALSCDDEETLLPCFQTPWEGLAEDKKLSAKTLGYTKEDWDELYAVYSSN